MTTQIKLFTQTKDYYAGSVAELESASNDIPMTYLTFDDGIWARRIANVLCRKAAGGVRVRLMVDEIGLFTDKPRHILRNHSLLQSLCSAGVQVDIFRPCGYGLSQLNRLHSKICAIDVHTAFIGGSNIGDYSLGWSDTNLCLNGNLGHTFHAIYDYLRQFSSSTATTDFSQLNPSDLWAGDVHIWLTIPGQRTDIRRALLHLIRTADQAIYIAPGISFPMKRFCMRCALRQSGVFG